MSIIREMLDQNLLMCCCYFSSDKIYARGYISGFKNKIFFNFEMELAIETGHKPCKTTLLVNCSKIFVACIDGLLNSQCSLVPQWSAQVDFVNKLEIVGSCHLFVFIARRIVLDSCRQSVQLTRHCVIHLFL